MKTSNFKYSDDKKCDPDNPTSACRRLPQYNNDNFSNVRVAKHIPRIVARVPEDLYDGLIDNNNIVEESSKTSNKFKRNQTQENL